LDKTRAGIKKKIATLRLNFRQEAGADEAQRGSKGWILAGFATYPTFEVNLLAWEPQTTKVKWSNHECNPKTYFKKRSTLPKKGCLAKS
jgi:hypothetical protein